MESTIPTAGVAFQRSCEALIYNKIQEAIASGKFEATFEYGFVQDVGIAELLKSRGYTTEVVGSKESGYNVKVSWLPKDLPKKPKVVLSYD